MEYTVIMHPAEEGGYWAENPCLAWVLFSRGDVRRGYGECQRGCGVTC